jgi:hypothetical protein
MLLVISPSNTHTKQRKVFTNLPSRREQRYLILQDDQKSMQLPWLTTATILQR